MASRPRQQPVLAERLHVQYDLGSVERPLALHVALNIVIPAKMIYQSNNGVAAAAGGAQVAHVGDQQVKHDDGHQQRLCQEDKCHEDLAAGGGSVLGKLRLGREAAKQSAPKAAWSVAECLATAGR